MMRIVFLLLLGVIVFANGPATANNDRHCVGRVCFDPAKTVGGEQIPLRGAGLLRYWGFRVYTVAFYVEQDATDLKDILENRRKALVIRYHRDIKSSDIVKSSDQLIRGNSKVDYEAVRDRLKLLYESYRSVRDGDEYRVVYEPEVGTTIYFNGEEEITIEGADFAAAFFGIWISDWPVSYDLQEKLLNPNGTKRS